MVLVDVFLFPVKLKGSKRCCPDSSPWLLNRKKNLKKTRFCIPTEPLKSLEKKGKTHKIASKILARKNMEFQKSKERKDREQANLIPIAGELVAIPESAVKIC